MLLLEISVRMVEKQLIVMKEDLFYFKELMKNMMFPNITFDKVSYFGNVIDGENSKVEKETNM